jgi:hypothetical protein
VRVFRVLLAIAAVGVVTSGTAGSMAAPATPARQERRAGPPSSRPTLRVGAARVDITPGSPVALQGYEEPQDRISAGVHDRLFARAVAFQAGARRLVVVSCDLGSMAFGPYFLRFIEDRWGLQPGEVLLCATHTHSGPQQSLNADYPHPNNFRYTRSLEGQLTEVTGKALAAMKPATLEVGRGRAAVGVSRRTIVGPGQVEMAPNPAGAADPEVLALRATSASGAPLALLFTYASHARSLGKANRLVSGDILGIAEQVVESSGGAGLVAAAFAGASGDVDPVSVVDGFDAPADGTPVPVRLGTLLGEEALRAARAARTIPGGVAIRSATARVMLPPKTPGQAKWVNVVIAAVGDIAMVGLDCEASVEVGLAIRQASPFAATFVITNCNGWCGYLPTARQHGEGGYEVARTGFGPGAADVLTSEVVGALARLRGRPAPAH